MPRESIDEFLDKKLLSLKNDLKKLDENDLRYDSLIEYEKTTLPIFESYELDLSDEIPDTKNLNNIFFSSIPDELSGIVIIGIDKTTMKSSYTKFEMLLNGKNYVLICNEDENTNIKKSEITVFA